ncbi:hypothetical protein NPIL_510461 [Nephila pilipes]|uniref:Uncharacterized protein n=1 Tax=Nephila pilipes TaxID=299642 RepID=A0A8X6QDW3_NEPPI|nr:hypothetical protein NPIL_510461 [Nephila pilipes]
MFHLGCPFAFADANGAANSNLIPPQAKTRFGVILRGRKANWVPLAMRRQIQCRFKCRQSSLFSTTDLEWTRSHGAIFCGVSTVIPLSHDFVVRIRKASLLLRKQDLSPAFVTNLFKSERNNVFVSKAYLGSFNGEHFLLVLSLAHPIDVMSAGRKKGAEKGSHISGYLGAQIATSEEEKKAPAADSIRRT